MSNLIPPLLSSSPPPIIGPLDEEDDDEFGDFRAAADSYDCDDFSLPPSPQKSPEKEIKSDFSKVNLDINSNNSQKIASTTEMPSKNIKESVDKDFQDRRKSVEDQSTDLKLCEIEVNCSNSQSVAPSNIFDIHSKETVSNNSEIIEQDQIIKNLDERPVGANNDQISEITKCSDIVEDDFSELQCGVPSSITNHCDPVQHTDDVNNVEVDDNEDPNDLNSLSNEENLFEDFNEALHFEKTNSDELSELNDTNEIKSEDDCVEEINFEITNDNSSKEVNCENSESSLSIKVCETDPKLSDDEFGDFEYHFANETETKLEKEENTVAIEDDFDDFVSPLPPPPQQSADVDEEEDNDDFGDFESSDLTKGEFEDFGDFSGCEKPAMMEIDTKNAFDKSEVILKEIFPVLEKDIDDFEYFNDTKGDAIFEELKDVTETNALIYQWSKSNSQKMFLKALNIDMRNILYGPAWNCSMPRFAANLGLTPLEPVKTEILTPTPVQNVSSPSNSSQKNNSDIPTAQFDWSGSGLINPLDSTTTELPGNVPEESSQPHVKTDFLPTTSEKSEFVPSLFETETRQKAAKEQTAPGAVNFELSKPQNDQADDFSSFQSPKMIIPLRETHISNETINDCGAKPGWLEPTILTPDLPRKEPALDPEEDDEFDDFQMVLPEEKPANSEIKTNNAISSSDLSEFDTTDKAVAPPVNKTPHNQEHIVATPASQSNLFSSGPIGVKVQKQTSAVNNEDDEFTDFHSSLPQSVFTPLQPVPVEPLKPSVNYTTPVATQINWPDPGVTDEDIKNIELSYSRKTEPDKTDVKNKPETSKENSLDEDEWSDFVSVTNPVKSVLPERTSTPDLPLSVLNLNHVQAPKQPIPVITPAGLVQTKLSSNLSLQPKSSNVVQTTLQPSLVKPQPTQLQPSIISHQFAANFSQPSKSQDDDDDWSDFVSSQPLPHVSNGYQQKATFRPPPMNWTNANIITNPGHFESFQGYGAQQGKRAASARSAIPSISAMPDLDFIAPKNRTKK